MALFKFLGGFGRLLEIEKHIADMALFNGSGNPTHTASHARIGTKAQQPGLSSLGSAWGRAMEGISSPFVAQFGSDSSLDIFTL